MPYILLYDVYKRFFERRSRRLMSVAAAVAGLVRERQRIEIDFCGDRGVPQREIVFIQPGDYGGTCISLCIYTFIIILSYDEEPPLQRQ